MKIVGIGADNFMSFKSMALSIPDSGLVFVGGEVKDSAVTSSNGAGKSALFEALCWGLYGKTLRGTAVGDVANWSSPRNCRVQVQFLDDHNTLYVVERYRNDKEYGNALRLFKETDDITSQDSRATQELIEAIISMSWLVFSTAVVFGEKAQRFTEAKDSEKKAIFDEILMLQRYQDALKAVREDLRTMRDERTRLMAKASAAESTHAAARHELEEAEAAIQELEASQESSQGRVAIVAKEIRNIQIEHSAAESQLQEAQRQRDELDANNRELMTAVSEAERSKLAIESKASRPGIAKRLEIQNIEGQIAETERKSKSLRSLRGKESCPMCLQPLSAHSVESVTVHYREQAAQLNEQLIEVKAELIRLQKEERAAIAEAQKNLNDVIAIKIEIDGKARRKVVEITTLTVKVRELGARLVALERERDSLTMRYEERKRVLDQQLTRANQRVEQCVADYEARLAEVAQSEIDESYLKFWEEGFGNQGIKSFLLDEILPALNDRVGYYATALMGESMRIEFDTESTLKGGGLRDKFDIRIMRDGVKVDYVACSNGERRRVDVAILLALQSLVYERNAAGCNLVVLDEVFDSLDRVGVEKVVSLLADEAETKTIFVISHLNEMRDYFNQEVIIVKENGVSEVVQ
jgi:DNA repair exonuclease SbcCD ATPase subunit